MKATDKQLIEDFIEIAKKNDVQELEFEKNDIKLKVSFSSGHVVQNFSRASMTEIPSAPAKTIEVSDDCHVIYSPFVGTFYTAPSPDKPAYAKVGDKVTKGQTLCILEAMKIMNEIESDVSGEVVEICVENENLVEYGQPLFKIRK